MVRWEIVRGGVDSNFGEYTKPGESFPIKSVFCEYVGVSLLVTGNSADTLLCQFESEDGEPI